MSFTVEELEEQYRLYPNWSPVLVGILTKLDRLDEIERISIILECSPKDTPLQELANAIDPGYNYKTSIKSWYGALRYSNSIYQRNDGIWYYDKKIGTPTEKETRLSILANMYLFFLNSTSDPFKEGDWSETWERNIESAKRELTRLKRFPQNQS